MIRASGEQAELCAFLLCMNEAYGILIHRMPLLTRYHSSSR